MRGHIFGEDRKASDENPRTQLEQKQVIHSRTKSFTTNITPSFALQDPCIHNLDRSSRFYLDYYNLRVAKLFILYDIAVAARHFANAGQSFDQVNDGLSPRFINANLDAFHFKQQAIKALSLSLSHPEPSQKDAIMPAILLLIFLDLLESGIEGWKYHLRGAEGLVNLSHSMLEPSDSKSINGNPGETVEETRRFITRQFSLVSTFGGALSGSKSSPEFCMNFDESRHHESIIRSFLGCPVFLLRAIRYFSNQRHVIKSLDMHDDLSIHEHVQNTLSMLELTANFDCLEWASNSVESSVSSAAELQKLSLLSQAYKTATILYGNRVLRAFKTSTGPIASDNEELVLRLLDVIESLQCDPALFKCLLWPTFIAGLECQTHSEQNLVIGFLKMLWNLTSCLNVINASKMVHDNWKRKNFDGNLASGESELYVIEQGWLLI
ncbi:transcriptional regulator family: Fungal Specific TF [Penicillium roqueforti]|nr:transcriptional regulator family: Fungal Specific TF [Penicillium roqueforti]KAI2762900.1 transcriptional regulator family: Fungal Specific TF [Penicillium roqueforti]KAI3133746.1 transcriptional regulator family: Fungal Specific TF [Penicillium roqueforti]KAI3231669.1 transcriptional regulator family: Fungal Specific TF [Penicillium roqueforti]KAI3255803.1 transcriptional regulator family: Fungal Specific TF [Penicillium roqueforti]